MHTAHDKLNLLNMKFSEKSLINWWQIVGGREILQSHPYDALFNNSIVVVFYIIIIVQFVTSN